MTSRPPLQVGDVVRNVKRWGPGEFSAIPTCPGCHRIVRRNASHCSNCSTTFLPVTEQYVQVVGVREYAAP